MVTEEDRRRADLAEEELQVSVALQLSMDATRNPEALITPAVVVKNRDDERVHTQPVIPGGNDEDEDINRLVTNDDTKSVVSQWGRRTDQGSETHKDKVEKINTDEGEEEEMEEEQDLKQDDPTKWELAKSNF